MNAAARRIQPDAQAVILLRPANEHQLHLQLPGRIGREFSREQVADLAAALETCTAEHGHALIAAFLPGFSRNEYRQLSRAVREFERLAAIEAGRENPRHWRDTIRVSL